MTNFALIKSKMAASRPFQFFFLISRKSCMIADLRTSALSYFTYPSHTTEYFLLHFNSHIINPLITRTTNKEILFSAFQEKVSSGSLFIWLICTAMSANAMLTFWEQMILKWPFRGHFEFDKFCDIYVTQKQSKKAGPCI